MKNKRPVTIKTQGEKETAEHHVYVYSIVTTFEITDESVLLQLEELKEFLAVGDSSIVSQNNSRDWIIEIYKSKAAALKQEADQDQSLYIPSNYR